MHSKVNLPQFWGGFSETFTFKLPKAKILADLGESFLKKKGYSYGGLPFELHPAAFGECGLSFLWWYLRKLKENMAERILGYSKNSSYD